MKRKKINKYEQQYKDLAREVNERFKEIKNAGYSKLTPAQNTFKSIASSNILGKNKAVLLKPKVRSKKEYLQGIQDMKKFLSYRTSNISGYESLLEERRNALRDKLSWQGMKDKDISKLTDQQLNSILDFLGSESGEVGKAKYDSDQVVLALSIAKIKGDNTDVESIFKKIDENYITIAEYIREAEKNASNSKGGYFEL